MLGATLALGALTVAFVLIVLPQRFVLQGDLRASGVSFPTTRVPFQPSEVSMRPSRPMPAPAPAPAQASDPSAVASGERESPAEPASARGPAEVMWDSVGPLLASGENGRALEVLEDYLEEHPEEVGVRMERAVTLVRAGRSGEAEWALRGLLSDTENPRARVELARLLLQRGAVADADAVLAELDVPADAPIAAEVALLAVDIRLALDPDTIEVPPAERLDAAPHAAPDLDKARDALVDGDLDRARSFYEAVLAEDPDDPALLLEWADAGQFRFEDLNATLAALERRAELVTPTTEDRFRLAQLYVWTGSEAEAEPLLHRVLSDDPGHAEAWAMLGEVHRWAGRRPASADAYDRALALDPTNDVALAGAPLLAEDTRRAIESVDTDRARPTLSFFQDSDGFERLEARAYASALPIPEVLEVEVGARRLGGIDALGGTDTDDGAFVEGTLARWWREGNLRTALTLGAESSSAAGTDLVAGARLQALDLYGWNLDARVRTGPAHYLTSTLGSVASGLRANQLSLGYYHGLPAGFELSGAVEGTTLRGSGASAFRFAAGAAFSRTLGEWFRTGISSRYIGYSDAAPDFGTRALFWDPELFWSNGLLVELRTPQPQGDGTSAFLRATPGMAWAEERDAAAAEWIRQFEAEGGLRIERRSIALTVQGFYTEGREGGYTSKGLTIGVEVTR